MGWHYSIIKPYAIAPYATMALKLDVIDADMLEITEKKPKLPEDKPKFPFKKPYNPFRATPCIYRYYIHGSSTAREAQFLAV